MTLPKAPFSKFRSSRKHRSTDRAQREQSRKRRAKRHSLLESLEARQLLAGPELIGIQPNEGSLLQNGTILNVSPRELVFQFDDNSEIDPNSLDAIRITRSGEDRVFESATATSDLGTSGAIVIEFQAAATGAIGNGITVNLTSSLRTGPAAPIVTVGDRTVTIDLNSNPLSPTSVQDLISTVNNNPAARSLIEAIQVSGPSQTVVGTTVQTSTLTLQGANSAEAVTDFGTNSDVQVRFVSQIPGAGGLGTNINFVQRNFGGPANPLVLVTGQAIEVQLNSTFGFESTTADVINAINSNPDSAGLVTASLQQGDVNRVLGGQPLNIPNITLSGVSDIVVTPGFVGLGDTNREVVFRFAEPLPDDIYQLDILGTGINPLRSIDGDAFQMGVDLTTTFSINLGPQVAAVVPEPVRRNADGSLSPDIGIIEVHFNQDDLAPALAERPEFYQLIFTNDTANNLDDVIRIPQTVTYNNITNIAVLDFQEPLSRLRPEGVSSGDFLTGAARLRIGGDEALPSAPDTGIISADPGDSFDANGTSGPFDLETFWTINTDSSSSTIISSEIFNTVPFDLDLPGPDSAGTRSIRPDDPTRLTRAIPLDFVRGGPDVIDGISVIQYDFAESFLGDDPNRAGIVNDTTFFNVISEQQKQRVREALQLFSEYLGVNFVEVEGNATSSDFFSIVVGDLAGGDPNATSGQGGQAVVTADRNGDGIDDLGILDFQDFDESIDDDFGDEFFRGAMFVIGQLLGFGFADDLPQPVTQSSDFIFQPGGDIEPSFPSVADIVNGQFLFRPDSTDIDLYEFTLETSGTVSIETIAERLSVPSLLDTTLRLYFRPDSSQPFVEIAQNDDYFSNDSLITIEASAGEYVVGVSAHGNDIYDPTISESGFGGLSEGEYDLRVDFRPDSTFGITDTTGIPLDGDADGRPGGFFDFWFDPSDPSNTVYVDKANFGFVNNITAGSAANPFTEIDVAIDFVESQIANGSTADFTIRIVGNGGADGLVETLEDNFSYQIGFGPNGNVLEDGSTLEIPKDVNLVIDSGAILKLSRSRIGIGSVSPTIDLSNSSLQILGTPNLIAANGLPARDSAGNLIPGSVILTSINDDSVGAGNTPTFTPAPFPGDWGGLDFQGVLDAADESRRNRELEGSFLNYVQHADIRYGGGAVTIGGSEVVVSPIELSVTRPTIVNSIVSDSADAAIAATPDTFAETRFTDPFFQGVTPFTPDISRVGPEIRGNTVIDNSINGLFIRLQARNGSEIETITQPTRFDDTDITHVLTENLVIEGTPGGPVIQSSAPSALLIRPSAIPVGNVPEGTYVYRITNVSDSGLESAASLPTIPVTLDSTGGILLEGLPTVSADTDFVSRRLYRASVDPVTNEPLEFTLVAQLNASSTTFQDLAAAGTLELATTGPVLRSRLDASLVIDPGTVIKLDGSRIEARFGANIVAEGLPSLPIVFTSIEDQQYGAGGTFDTNDRGGFGELTPGDWGGIYLGHGSSGSFDHTVITGGGGTTRIEGGFASFNALEVFQADLRLTNSTLENNADGRGQPAGTRVGRGENGEGTVFVVASSPIIVGNDFVDGGSSAISFDLNSFNSTEVSDRGRSTGLIDRVDIVGNTGPLIQNNSLTGNAINGLEIRGGQLATQGVWDDVDITHVVRETIEVPNQHVFGGLRLQSDARGSLVVKFESSEDDVAGIVVGGSLLTAEDALRDIPDRIGGALQVIGHSDFPVVLTSLSDDTVGAGFTRDGQPALDTNGDGLQNFLAPETGGTLTTTLPTGPEVNLGTLIDNDVSPTIPGFFSATISNGNDVGLFDDNLTVETAAGQLLQNQSFIFAYNTYITIGNASTQLSATTITQPATLIADDLVESRGTFAGPNGLVNWIAQSTFADGSTTLTSALQLEADGGGALGDIRVVTYLDEDVQGISDDILATVGTPGEADFRAFTLDGPLRVGFSHGGFYSDDGINQINAVYAGWAADQFPELETAIIAGTQTYSIAGTIDLADLPVTADPDFGTVNGPNDVTTAFAWDVIPTASNSTVTSFLELLPQDPVAAPVAVATGIWNGITIREGASDRNVAAAAEDEPLRTAFFGTNDIPSESQFLGELAPNELAGDENRRLGFIVNGAITTRDDLDVFSFVAESNTEVWIDIDRTGIQFDSVVELIDANGFTLAASNDSILAETNPNALFSASNLNPDAVQSLSVITERLEVQEIQIGESIENTTGDLTLTISSSNENVLIPVDAFLSDPASAIETALETTFPNEIGDLTVSLLRRSEGDDFVIRVQFDETFFVGRSAPDIAISSIGLLDQSVNASVTSTLLDSQLQDTFTSNPRDAGLRIVLPGEAGTINEYHVRVRSSNTRDPLDFSTLAVESPENPDDASSQLRNGLTTGRYELQIRLQEEDETAGTQINLADIRFATNGVQVIGQPFHSPLLGEELETSQANDTIAQAQPLGLFGQAADDNIIARINQAQIDVTTAQAAVNAAATQQEIADAQLALQNAQDDLRSVRGLLSPLQSDTLSTSFGGVLDSPNDVDWFRFEVQFQNLTRDAADLYLSTIFDLDYASNFARADLGLYVFDAAGQLILIGGDSNIADDQPSSLTSNGTGSLSAGSAGTQDPFIGAAELIEGTYFVAIAAQARVPLPLDQFFNPASANPLVRLEPIESVNRIAEDRIESSGIGTANPPQIEFLFDDNSIVEQSLDDVLLYVNTAGGLVGVNPFTGENLGNIGNTGFGQGDAIRDVAFTRNGELFGYSLVDGANGDTAWAYHRIDTSTGAIAANLSVGAGITTREFSGNLVVNMMTGAVTPPVLDAVSNAGINVEAITIRAIRGQEEGFFVGNRGDLGNAPGINLPVFGPAPGNLVFGGPFGEGGLGYGENILYEFNPSTGQAIGANPPSILVSSAGAGTTPREIGFIDTDAIGGANTFLGISSTGVVNNNGILAQQIFDGDTFTVDDLVNDPVTLEFDLGFTLTATGGVVTDGDSFTVDGVVYEFNTGQSIQLEAVSPVGSLNGGSIVSVTAPSGLTAGFQFLSPGQVATGDNTGIEIIDAFGQPIDPTLLAFTLANAINASLPELGATSSGQDVVFNAARPTSLFSSGGGININGDSGLVNPLAVEIDVAPSTGSDALIAAVATALAGSGTPSSFVGNFISLPTANSVIVPQNSALTLSGSAPGVQPGNTPIFVLPTDTAETVALRVAAAFNGVNPGDELIPNISLTPSGSGNSLALNGAAFISQVSSQVGALVAGGAAPGGTITGIELVGNSIFAVSDTGGLWEVSQLGGSGPAQVGDFIEQSTDLLGLNFSGLRAGPNNVQDGALSDILFGITFEGDIHAFNTLGELQPVFAGGRSSISTGIFGAEGLDFSTLDFNLWHVSSERSTDPGHGQNALPNFRGGTTGGQSLAFNFEPAVHNGNFAGAEQPAATPRQDNQDVASTFNFPGGAQGVINSNSFSLQGYSPSDQPTLYFNYFSEVDNDNTDRLRVYVVDESGVEHLVASNSTTRFAGTGDDEFDDPNPLLFPVYDDDIDVDVQQLFDNTGTFRQARVPLNEFAGLQNLSLRIEFSTSGVTSSSSTTVRASAGNILFEGQSLVINNEAFSIDLAPAVRVPSGQQLANLFVDPAATAIVTIDGQDFVLDDGTRTTSADQTVVDLQTVITSGSSLENLTADQIAAAVQGTILANNPQAPVLSGFNFSDPEDVAPNVGRNDLVFEATPLPYESGNLQITGSGFFGSDPANGPVNNLDDVDLLQVNLQPDTTVSVNVELVQLATRQATIRFFDAGGEELQSTTANIDGQVFTQYTSTTTESIFIGLSDLDNQLYDPRFLNDPNLANGLADQYNATININQRLGVLFEGNLVEIEGAQTLTASPPELFTISGTNALAGNTIPVSRFDSATQVALATQLAVATRFAQGDLSQIPTAGPSVTLPLLDLGDAGPFALESDRFGDAFDSNFQSNPAFVNNTNLITTASGGNDFEGVYLDDFIIGFAERGERVTGSNPVTGDFIESGLPNIPVPADPVSSLRTGTYQVEIRDGSEVVASGDNALFRGIDTNDRLVSGALSFVARSADALQDGFTFSIDDGRSVIEFEFDLVESNTGVTPGRVPVPYTLQFEDPETGAIRPQNADEIATSIVEAINLDDVQSIIAAPAGKASGFDAVFDSRVNVLGDVIIRDESGAFAEVTLNNLRGDENRERDAQGVILIENTRFLFNENYGLDISHDLTAVVNGVETDSIIRFPRNLIELNTEGLVPGVVVQSNVFAFNGVGGLQITGIDPDLNETRNDPVAFDRIINNTFVGGTITEGLQSPSDTFAGTLFPSGSLSFADQVVSFDPNAGGAPPAFTFQNQATVLGAPDSISGGEPVDGATTLSLGLGGTLVVEFTNNLLTGSGDAQPDLAIFEVGAVESIRVEISRDGTSFFDVGVIGGLTNSLDIDSAGFGTQDRFAFVRLTDLRQGDSSIPQLGADIDAIGAISSAPVDNFTPGGIGINIVGGAAPTLLNNLISNSTTGVQIDATNTSAVLGANSFYRNEEDAPANVSLGQFAQVISPSEVVFVGADQLVFSPAAGASIIDSSIDLLEDRTSLASVRDPLGIPPSPIIAPRLDVTGQLRVDDPSVETPSGLGESVFIDRGAADRSDSDGPRAVLLTPRAPGLGTGAGAVSVLGDAPQFFEIQLIDGLSPADVAPGSGIDDGTISSASILLLQDNEPLVEGIDYRFGYNPSTNIIRITPIAGVFETDSTYVIRLIDSTDAVVAANEGTGYTDGTVLNVLDTLGAAQSFEYETGITLSISTSLTGQFADGIVFDVFDGSTLLTFELDSNGLFDATNNVIAVPPLADSAAIAEIIATTLNASPALDFAVNSSGSTIQLLGGTPLSSATTTSNFVAIEGTIGTSVGFGIQIPNFGAIPDPSIIDGQSFTINRGSLSSVTFELNSDGFLNDPNATSVAIFPNASLDVIAGELVRAIAGAGLGLNPINAGFGRVILGGDANTSLDLTNSTLQQIGTPGLPATFPITIPIDATATESAVIIAAAIDSQNLPGVSTSIVDSRVFLDGTGGVSGVGAVDLVTVADQVGNELQSNQLNGRTELTIFVGSGFDFGDAPAPFVSLEVNGGPRHAVDEGFSIGNSVTPDANAVLPDQDIDDGVIIANTLQSGFDTNITIEINNVDGRQFYLDAWFDWDADGVFEPSEQLRFGSVGTGRPVLGTGSNNVLVSVPAGTVVGETFARFRLSESPNLGPLGDASSGEVEDHRIFISNNPFQNPTNFTDVNASGFTSPIDALQVINVLDRANLADNSINLSNSSEIPSTVPQFPDVNGDGFVTALDALLVINSLNSAFPNGEQVAEGESVARTFVPAASGVLASSATALGDALIEDAQATASTIEQEATSSVSIFDSPAAVNLDSIVDSIAQDTAQASGEDDETNALDQLFAQL